MIIIYNGLVEPFNKRSINKKEMVNEFFIVMITDTLFIFTDFCDALELKYNVGWAYVFIMVITIFFNSYFILLSISKSIYKIYRIITC